MKVAIFALLLVVAGAFAAPEPVDVDPAQGRIVDIIIRSSIENVIRWIRNSGLDPYDIVERNFHHRFPGLLDLRGRIRGLNLRGLSNILINDLSYNILFGRLTFDLSIPEIALTVQESNVSGIALGRPIEGSLNGSVVVETIRLRGVALLILDVNWVQVYNIDVDLSIANIKSELTVTGQDGVDRSEEANRALAETVPNFLKANRGIINTALGQIIREIVSWWNINRN